MTKLVLDSVAGGYDLSKINSNFQAIQDELQNKVLYRDNPDGEANTLESDIDANGKTIYNLASIQVQGYPDLGSLVEGVEADKVASEAAALAASDSEVAAEAALAEINTYRIVWKGAWSGVTNYEIYDAVEVNGSSYIAKAPSLNITPPNASYWELLASKGSDGGGAGDVVGPASSVGSAVPVFGDTSGKLIVDSGVLLSDKQDTLVSGTNIKTVNGSSLVGSGDVVVAPTYASDVEAAARTEAAKVLSPATFSAANIVMGTAVATTSGTAIDFTGIPTWAKRVNLMFTEVSTAGTSNLILRLGGSSGIETAGYLGASSYAGNAVPSAALSHSAGFLLSGISNVAVYSYSGVVTFSLRDEASTIWCVSGMLASTDSARVTNIAGYKSITGSLASIRLTTIGGVDAFDAGTINISWE